MTNLDELIHYTFICILYDVLHVISTFSSRIKKHLCNNFTQIVSILLLCKFGKRFLTSFCLHEQKFNPHCCPIFFLGAWFIQSWVFTTWGCFTKVLAVFIHMVYGRFFIDFLFIYSSAFLVKFQKHISPVFKFIKLNSPSFKDALIQDCLILACEKSRKCKLVFKLADGRQRTIGDQKSLLEHSAQVF